MALSFCEFPNGQGCLHYDDIEAEDDEIQKCLECDGYKSIDACEECPYGNIKEEGNYRFCNKCISEIEECDKCHDVVRELKEALKQKDEEIKELKEAHVDEHQLVLELEQEIKEHKEMEQHFKKICHEVMEQRVKEFSEEFERSGQQLLLDKINAHRANVNRILRLIKGCETMEQLNSLKDLPLFEE